MPKLRGARANRTAPPDKHRRVAAFSCQERVSKTGTGLLGDKIPRYIEQSLPSVKGQERERQRPARWRVPHLPAQNRDPQEAQGGSIVIAERIRNTVLPGIVWVVVRKRASIPARDANSRVSRTPGARGISSNIEMIEIIRIPTLLAWDPERRPVDGLWRRAA